MKDSQQHQITKSTPKTDGRFPSGEQHPNWLASKIPGSKGKQYGQLMIISDQIQRRGKRPRIYHHCQCLICKRKDWIDRWWLLHLTDGGCKKCNTRKFSEYAEVLGRRYDAIIARCYNPANPAYHRYGGRGIQCKFKSRREFILWVSENLPHKDYKGAEIDRINNDGHYEPGNLRLATRREQVLNKSDNVWMLYQGQRIQLQEFKSPYTESWTRRLVVKGLTGEEIIELAKTAVARKAKHNKLIQARLEQFGYMTS
jgi:hypothetical protein